MAFVILFGITYINRDMAGIEMHVVCQTLAGLDHAHELKDFDGTPLNVVHRDISPHNLMVTYDGHVKLLDFGIAKAADSSNDTRTGVMKGKCAYMPAEQFGGKNIDRRADIFAVGVILWQALTGRRLWRGLSDAEIFQHVAIGSIPLPSSIVPGVDLRLEAVAMKALARNRDDRYATASEMQNVIEDIIASTPAFRVNAKELGRYVSELFTEDRKKLKSIIESALKAPRPDAILNLAEEAPSSRLLPDTVASAPGATSPITATFPVLLTPSSSRGARIYVFGAVGVAAIAAIVGSLSYGPKQPIATTAPTAAASSAAEKTIFILRANPSSSRAVSGP